MTLSRHTLLSLSLALLATAMLCSPAIVAGGDAASDSKASSGGEWIQLFNGKNLDGWIPKFRGYELGENYADTFRVEDGKLVVRYDKGYDDGFKARFGHLFHESSFSNYILRVEYRFVGEQCPGGAGWALRNSGIMMHGQTPESMRKDQPFPVSMEVQLLGGPEQGTRPTANLCTPGTNFVRDGKLITTHCVKSTSETLRGDQWVTVEVEVHGGKSVEHRVNGETVFSYTEPQLDPNDGDARKLIEKQGGEKLLTGGSISLQAESHPVEFRKVELKKLAD